MVLATLQQQAFHLHFNHILGHPPPAPPLHSHYHPPQVTPVLNSIHSHHTHPHPLPRRPPLPYHLILSDHINPHHPFPVLPLISHLPSHDY